MDYSDTSYMQRKMKLMLAYDKLMGFDTNPMTSPFGYMCNRWDEFTMTGSFRQFLNTKFAALNIHKLYGLDIISWSKQSMYDIFTQMGDVSTILDIQSAAAAEFEKNNSLELHDD